MKVLIIEDQRPAAKNLTKMLGALEGERIRVLDVLRSVKEAVVWFKNHAQPDLIFMDIELTDGSCFEIFQEVQVDAPVIFTTAFDDYMIEAFENNGLAYLLKPVDHKNLVKAIQKYNDLKSQFTRSVGQQMERLLQAVGMTKPIYRSRWLVKTGHSFISLQNEDIYLFFTEDGVSFAMTKAFKKYILDQSLNKIEQQLDPVLFFRINRQMIVPLQSIASFQPFFNHRIKIALKQDIGKDAIVSRERVQAFKRWMGEIND